MRRWSVPGRSRSGSTDPGPAASCRSHREARRADAISRDCFAARGGRQCLVESFRRRGGALAPIGLARGTVRLLALIIRFSARAGSFAGGSPRSRRIAETSVMAPPDTGSAHGLSGGELGPLAGDRRALDHLFSATYEELRRLASSVRRSDPASTLSPTTLVNEAWLKLRNSPELASLSRVHFKRIAARAMRQGLIAAARP